ncbi:MAG: hypothetical protein GWP91_24850 [Rhodobacterales bacterium]|nr:hypothetical protein [Rhodobacterales bacterium]
MNILFCTHSSPGFLFPAIGLAQALVSLGHQVAFVTGRTQRPLLTHLGLAWLGGDASFRIQNWHSPRAVAVQLRHIEHAGRAFAADVLVGSALNLGALILFCLGTA